MKTIVIDSLKTDLVATCIKHFPKPGEHVYGKQLLVPHPPYPDGSDHPVSAPDTSVIPQSSYGYSSGMSKVSVTNPGQSSGRQVTGDEALVGAGGKSRSIADMICSLSARQ